MTGDVWLTVKDPRTGSVSIVPARGKRPKGVGPFTRDDVRSWCREGMHDGTWTPGPPPDDDASIEGHRH